MFPLSQLIPLVDKVIKEPRLQNGPLFYEVADILNFWKIRGEMSSDDGSAVACQRMLLNFWDGLSNICVGHVNRLDADEKSLAAISCLLQILQNPANQMKPKQRKAVKVRFSEDKAECNTDQEKDTRTSNELGTHLHGQHLSPLRNERLEDLVCKLAELSIVYTNEQRSDRHLKFLSALLSNFASNRVFQVLVKDSSNIKEAMKPQYENPAIQFLKENLTEWLKGDWQKETDFLVDILYSVLHCCSTQRESILNDLTKVLFTYR